MDRINKSRGGGGGGTPNIKWIRVQGSHFQRLGHSVRTSKNEGSLGEKPNFGSKLGGIR